MSNAMMPIIERRRIEAEIIKHIYDVLVPQIGKPAAQKVIAEAVRASAIEQGQRMAAEVKEGTSLESFKAIQSRWTAEDALRIEVTKEEADRFEFNVVRCRYSEMYREMGLGEIGHLLSCNRDGTFCEGYDDKLKLTRSQTIMQGASHCDFRYHYEKS